VAEHVFDKTQPPPELARALNYQAWGVGDIMNLPAGWLLRMNIVLNYYRAFTGYLNAAASNQSVEFTRKHPKDWGLVSAYLAERKGIKHA